MPIRVNPPKVAPRVAGTKEFIESQLRRMLQKHLKEKMDYEAVNRMGFARRAARPKEEDEILDDEKEREDI